MIEDNSDAREALVMGLRLDGQEVYEARTGAEGLDVVSQEQPELVLIDIGLPDLDGYEIARQLRKKAGRKLRLVALTGYGRQEDRNRSREPGSTTPCQAGGRGRHHPAACQLTMTLEASTG